MGVIASRRPAAVLPGFASAGQRKAAPPLALSYRPAVSAIPHTYTCAHMRAHAHALARTLFIITKIVSQ